LSLSPNIPKSVAHDLLAVAASHPEALAEASVELQSRHFQLAPLL
jgi:hypothetical protein